MEMRTALRLWDCCMTTIGCGEIYCRVKQTERPKEHILYNFPYILFCLNVLGPQRQETGSKWCQTHRLPQCWLYQPWKFGITGPSSSGSQIHACQPLSKSQLVYRSSGFQVLHGWLCKKQQNSRCEN